MEGNAKIIRLIARDEALHLSGTQNVLNIIQSGEDDPELGEIAKESQEEARNIFIEAAEQEKNWAKYLFQNGSMIGLNEVILGQYIEYITNQRLKSIGFEKHFDVSDKSPLPWMESWIDSSNVQVAPQESEISSYLVGQVDSNMSGDDLGEFEL